MEGQAGNKKNYHSAIHAPFHFGQSRAAIVCVSQHPGFFSYKHAQLLYRLNPLLTQALFSIQNIRQLKNAQEELEEKSKQLQQALGQATHLAQTDDLTQVLNRRSFFDAAEKELQRCYELDFPLAVIVLDIDNFKPINDYYGHSAGDEVLAHLAQICNSHLRKSDILARYGGEEFIALLPETTDNQAAKIAKRMQQAIAKTNLNGLPAGVRITISLGVAEKSSQQCSIEYLVDIADKAMYAAKRQGKNQVALYPL